MGVKCVLTINPVAKNAAEKKLGDVYDWLWGEIKDYLRGRLAVMHCGIVTSAQFPPHGHGWL